MNVKSASRGGHLRRDEQTNGIRRRRGVHIETGIGKYRAARGWYGGGINVCAISKKRRRHRLIAHAHRASSRQHNIFLLRAPLFFYPLHHSRGCAEQIGAIRRLVLRGVARRRQAKDMDVASASTYRYISAAPRYAPFRVASVVPTRGARWQSARFCGGRGRLR